MKFSHLLLLLLLIILVVACGTPEAPVNDSQAQVVAEQVDTEDEATATPTETQIPPSPTATDVPATVAAPPTLTPVPTRTPSPTPENTPTPTHTATPEDTPTPTATATYAPGPPPPPRPYVNPVPGAPSGYLSKYQLITFYGSPWGRALGILGNFGTTVEARRYMTRVLYNVVDDYQSLDSRHAMCTWHMVTTVANQNPPEYRHVVEESTIEVWVASAPVYECAVILDIQPGRVTIQEEFERIRRFLYDPHVHLAIDPEFDMTDEQVPNVHVGQTPAEDINWVQAQLQEIAMEIGVNRVLILHQFKDSMLPDKQNITNFPNVELVIDSDGAFVADIKVHNYLQYANEPGFEYGGIKIFYEYDDRILTAEDVMRLGPKPSVIIYQ